MIRPRRYLLLCAFASLVPMVAGCASTPAQDTVSAHATTSAHAARYVSGLTEKLDLAGTGIVLSPLLDQQTVPRISGQQAFETCLTGGSLCDPGLSPNVYLALADKPDSNIVAELVWVVDYPGSSCVPYGHPPAMSTESTSPEPTPSGYPCRLVNLIDSGTGQVLWSVRVPQ